jgi:acyl-CoA oxidase
MGIPLTVAARASEIEVFAPAALRLLLDGPYADLRQRLREILSRPEFEPVVGMPTAEYRERVLDWAKMLAGENLTAPGFPKEYGGEGDPGANVAAFETLGFGDLSLLVKFGVQFGTAAERSSSSGPSATTSAT